MCVLQTHTNTYINPPTYKECSCRGYPVSYFQYNSASQCERSLFWEISAFLCNRQVEARCWNYIHRKAWEMCGKSLILNNKRACIWMFSVRILSVRSPMITPSAWMRWRVSIWPRNRFGGEKEKVRPEPSWEKSQFEWPVALSECSRQRNKTKRQSVRSGARGGAQRAVKCQRVVWGKESTWRGRGWTVVTSSGLSTKAKPCHWLQVITNSVKTHSRRNPKISRNAK